MSVSINATIRYNPLTNLYIADAVFEGKLFQAGDTSEVDVLVSLRQKIKDYRDGTVKGYPKQVAIEI